MKNMSSDSRRQLQAAKDSTAKHGGRDATKNLNVVPPYDPHVNLLRRLPQLIYRTLNARAKELGATREECRCKTYYPVSESIIPQVSLEGMDTRPYIRGDYGPRMQPTVEIQCFENFEFGGKQFSGRDIFNEIKQKWTGHFEKVVSFRERTPDGLRRAPTLEEVRGERKQNSAEKQKSGKGGAAAGGGSGRGSGKGRGGIGFRND